METEMESVVVSLVYGTHNLRFSSSMPGKNLIIVFIQSCLVVSDTDNLTRNFLRSQNIILEAFILYAFISITNVLQLVDVAETIAKSLLFYWLV